jgi:hypothetical protein
VKEVEMQEDTARNAIRRLLKEFGVRSDELIISHLARNPEVKKLKLAFVLEDHTDYGDQPPDQPLQFEVTGEVIREG